MNRYLKTGTVSRSSSTGSCGSTRRRCRTRSRGYMYFTIAALKKIPPYMGLCQGMNGEEGVYVYRGVPDFSAMPNFEEVYAQGREVTWPSFSSVTANIDESRRLACSGADPSLRLMFVIVFHPCEEECEGHPLHQCVLQR